MIARLARALLRLIARGIYLLTRPFELASRWLTVCRPSAKASGFSIVVKSKQAPTDSVIAKLRDALALIMDYDARRFQRIHRDVPRVVALDLVLMAGTQWMRPRAILLKADLVHPHPPIWAAASIIHEATHIRLKQAGIHTTRVNVARIERNCVREEIDFLQRVAAQNSQYVRDAQHYVAGLEHSLDSPTPWYTLEHQWLEAREALVAASAPRWVIWLIKAILPSRVEEVRDGGA